jgi:hypothetical protein
MNSEAPESGVQAIPPEKLEKDFPSISLAYELAVTSYDTLLKRLENVDGKIQSVLTISVTVMALSPALATARALSFRSVWFTIAIAAATLVLALGSYARLWGAPRVLNPNHLFTEFLDYQQIEFKKNMIDCCGQDFDHNYMILSRKWLFSVLVTALFFIQVLALVAWAAAKAVAGS